MNNEEGKPQRYLEVREEMKEIFHIFWETIVPRYFPEVKDDDELADFLLNELMEELKEDLAAGREWNKTKED
jgi:hypothetical protein